MSKILSLLKNGNSKEETLVNQNKIIKIATNQNENTQIPSLTNMDETYEPEIKNENDSNMSEKKKKKSNKQIPLRSQCAALFCNYFIEPLGKTWMTAERCIWTSTPLAISTFK